MAHSFGPLIRRLLPALAVGTVLGIAALLPSTSLGATTNLGYGYANNCGVKGYGFHDHGKPCPNRPFPGKGKGLSIAIQQGTGHSVDQTSASTETSVGSGSTGGGSGDDVSTTNSSSSLTTDVATKPGKHLGWAHRGTIGGAPPRD
jgi:hypothetical protein